MYVFVEKSEKYQYFLVKMLLIWSFVLNAYMHGRTTDTQGQIQELNSKAEI